MKNYRLVKEESGHYQIHDTKDGSHFNVAKSGLSKQMLKKISGIQKFVDGGGVKPFSFGTPGPNDVLQTSSEPSPETPPTNLSPQEAGLQAYKQVMAAPIQGTRNGMSAPALATPDTRPLDEKMRQAEDQASWVKNNVESQQAFQDESNVQNAQDIASRNQKRAEIGLPPLPGSDMTQPSPDNGIKPMSFEAPQQVNPQGMPSTSMDEYNKAYGQEQKANTAIGQAQSERAQQEAATQNTFQNQMKQIHDDYKNQFDQNQKRQDEINADIQANPINANRYWENKSTLGKVSTIIGLLLGGAGSGGNASNNAASQALDSAINRDIENQKASMTQKNNLLGYYMKQYGNLQQAQMQTKSDLLTVTQSELNRIAAQSNDPIAKQNAISQNAQISLQKAQLNHQLAMQSAIYGSSDPLTAKIALGLQGEEQKRALDEKGSFENHQKALGNIKNLMGQAMNEESFGNYMTHPIETSRKADVLNAGIDDALLSTDTAKRMTPEAQKVLLDPYHIKVTDNKAVRGAKIQGALQKVNTFAPATPLLSGLGWLPSNKGPVNFKPR